jgi:hypothetical protein
VLKDTLTDMSDMFAKRCMIGLNEPVINSCLIDKEGFLLGAIVGTGPTDQQINSNASQSHIFLHDGNSPEKASDSYYSHK